MSYWSTSQQQSTKALRLPLPGAAASHQQPPHQGGGSHANPTIIVLLVLGVLFVITVALALFKLPHVESSAASLVTLPPPPLQPIQSTGTTTATAAAATIPPMPKDEYREFDLVLQLQQGVLVPMQSSANQTIRVFDLGTYGSDMDMLSIVLYTCCCNDHLVVICDGRSSDPSYAIQCFLSHNPSVPYHDSATQRYKHEWRLLIQYGSNFEEKLAISDCVFSARYHTTSPSTRPPPPPLAPSNELTKKVWG